MKRTPMAWPRSPPLYVYSNAKPDGEQNQGRLRGETLLPLRRLGRSDEC